MNVTVNLIMRRLAAATPPRVREGQAGRRHPPGGGSLSRRADAGHSLSDAGDGDGHLVRARVERSDRVMRCD